MMSPYSSDSLFSLSWNYLVNTVSLIDTSHLESLVDPLTYKEDDLHLVESVLVRSPGLPDAVASLEVLHSAADDD